MSAVKRSTAQKVEATETEVAQTEAKTEVQGQREVDSTPAAKPKAGEVPQGRIVPEGYDALPTKSAKIRVLNKEGWTRSEIARFMDIRYQHVRNVLITPIKDPTRV